MKFVFDDITHVGTYCMRLSINRQLVPSCDAADISLDLNVFHLPESVYSHYDRACDQDLNLADYGHYLRR